MVSSVKIGFVQNSVLFLGRDGATMLRSRIEKQNLLVLTPEPRPFQEAQCSRIQTAKST